MSKNKSNPIRIITAKTIHASDGVVSDGAISLSETEARRLEEI